MPIVFARLSNVGDPPTERMLAAERENREAGRNAHSRLGKYFAVCPELLLSCSERSEYGAE